MDRNRGLDKDQAASGAERSHRKPRQRKPAVLGIVVAASAVGAWLLRRERVRAPEGTWRDALLSDAPGKQGAPGQSTQSTQSGSRRAPGSGTDER